MKQKEFNKLLKAISTKKDLERLFDETFDFSIVQIRKYGNRTPINMLLNVFKLKAADHYSSYILYCKKFFNIQFDSKNSILKLNSKDGPIGYTPERPSISFLKWVDLNKKEIEDFSKSIELDPGVIFELEYLEQAKKYGPALELTHCPGCGDKLARAKDLWTHECNSKGASESIRTISGGGGPGTGKRR